MGICAYLLVVILILIFYSYQMLFSDVTFNKVFLDDLFSNKSCYASKLKTGDVVVFKAQNNTNSLMTGSYYGHIGIIYVDPDDPKEEPLIFESNGIEKMPLLSHHPKNGVFLSKLYDRLKKYKGRIFIKQLNKPVEDHVNRDFKNFINYARENMSYDYDVVSSGLKKALGIEKCNNKTNCCELVFLSLIKLQLLSIEEYDKIHLHYLLYTTRVKKLHFGYCFNEMIEIIDHPFDK